MNLLGLLSIPLLASVSDCSKGASLFKISSLSFLPDPPVKGTNSTLMVSMTVPTEVQMGTVTYSFTYNFIPIPPTVEDLCTVVSCPILPGPLDVSSSYPIDPNWKGIIVANIDWRDTLNTQLMCVSITMKL